MKEFKDAIKIAKKKLRERNSVVKAECLEANFLEELQRNVKT